MSLAPYRKKRSFAKTPEPKGRVATKGGNHFVVHRHQASHLHFDLRLEMNGVLKSWAVPKGPSMDPKVKRLAMHVEDHPLAYRTFHGTIPKGQYGAGTVEIWDSGTYELKGPKRIKDGEITFTLHGKKLKGDFTLVRMKNAQGHGEPWLLIKRHDEVAHDPDDPPPHHVKPMLATLVDESFNREGWIFEIKWDGFRAIAEVMGGKVELYSRNFQPFNEKMKDLIPDLSKMGHDVILDGEAVVLDREGRSRFQLLQDFFMTGKGTLVYEVFDILYLDGEDLRTRPLHERKQLLHDILPKSKHLRYSDHIEKNGIPFFNAAKRKGLEGIMAKKADGPYRSGVRSEDWLKMKAVLEQEAVIAGYTEPRRSRKYLGAVVLGVYENGRLTYIGHTGGGSDDAMLQQLYRKLKPLEIDASPFDTPPKTNAPVHWVKPKLVCEVKFEEWTKDGYMRQPILLGLRSDKNATEVTRELPADVKQRMQKKSEGEFTHAEKVFFPKDKITKGDLRDFYLSISKYILPYLKDRPESLNRFPNGIAGENFFHKDVPNAPEWVKTAPIHSESENKTITSILCNDERTLEYLVQLGCIEINPWNSRVKKLDNPDYLIMDLDPEGVSFTDVVRTALECKKVFDLMGAPSVCKTSGKRGLHVFVPLGAKYSYEHVRLFAEFIAELVRDRLPDIVSLERKPEKRQHNVYIDYLQNKRGATTCSVYSVRPKPGAPVSTPLKWSEVNAKLDPSKFTIKTVPVRLKKVGDLWKPVLGKGIDMKECLRRIEKFHKKKTRGE